MLFLSKTLANYLIGNIFNLFDVIYLSSNVFYFSSICIKKLKTKSFISSLVVY